MLVFDCGLKNLAQDEYFHLEKTLATFMIFPGHSQDAPCALQISSVALPRVLSSVCGLMPAAILILTMPWWLAHSWK